MASTQELIATLRRTVMDMCRAENTLGGVAGSFGYNAVAAKLDVAQQAYEAAVKAVEARMNEADAGLRITNDPALAVFRGNI